MYRLLFLLLTLSPLALAGATIETERQDVAWETLTTGLEHPWGLAFLPDGDMLVTERPGRLRWVRRDGTLEPSPVAGLPTITAHGQGGALDVALHPAFDQNHWLYLSYAERTSEGIGTAVGRGQWRDGAVESFEVLFRLLPKSGTRHHFGSRLVFDNDGHLFITLGDRGNRDRAQRLDDHAGSVIRIHDDGRIPDDNPFVGQPDARPEIWSYGHRNAQGAALHPDSGEVWLHEHGPQGGDEINIPRRGRNYGWPVITYGVNYVIGTSIGEGTHKPGMEQPLHYWVPSIAPSGMSFYRGDRFPRWKGNLFIGSLKFRQLVRLELDGDSITHEERMFDDMFGRIRDVRQGPDGLLYLLTDANNGKLIRLRPAD